MRGVRTSRTTLLATLLLLTSAAPASALPAGRSGLYGGGAVRDYMQFVSAQVRPDGRFTVNATLVTRCSPRFGDSLTESVTVREELTPDGRYSKTSTFEDELETGLPTVGGLHAEGTIRLSMQVLAGGRARGAIRVLTTYTDPRTGAEVARCDTGRIGWTARRPFPDTGDGRVTLQPGTHRGTTKQGQPFLARVTKRGRFVRRAGLTVRIDCPSGIGLPLDVVAHRIRVKRGRFGAGGRFERPFTYPDGTRVVEHYSWAMHGRFGAGGARGSFRMRGVVRRERDGERIGSCATGQIPWRAAR
jgi:hypothetical protein